jgi:hypothetical protein
LHETADRNDTATKDPHIIIKDPHATIKYQYNPGKLTRKKKGPYDGQPMIEPHNNVPVTGCQELQMKMMM